MPSPTLSLSRLSVALLCGIAVGSARADLLKISPFLPPQGTSTAPTANAPIVYQGTMVMDDQEQYRIVDPQHKIGTWLKVGERDANLDVVLKQVDKDHETVTVEHGGQSMTLPLKTAKVVSGGSAQPMLPPPPQMPGPNVSPAVIQTASIPNPTPADEQRRLEAVAAEVARRRALREQAAQQSQQQAGGVAPMPQPPMATRQDMQQQQVPQQPRRVRAQ